MTGRPSGCWVLSGSSREEAGSCDVPGRQGGPGGCWGARPGLDCGGAGGSGRRGKGKRLWEPPGLPAPSPILGCKGEHLGPSPEMSCTRTGEGRWKVFPQDPSFPSPVPAHFLGLNSSPTPASSVCLSVCLLGAFPPLSLLSASSGQSFEHQLRGERGGGKAGSAFPGPPRPRGLNSRHNAQLLACGRHSIMKRQLVPCWSLRVFSECRITPLYPCPSCLGSRIWWGQERQAWWR